MMKVSPTFWVIVTVAVGSALILLAEATRTTPRGKFNPAKVVSAAQAYAQDLRSHGRAVPQSVRMEELIARGLLNTNDVSDFNGMEVELSLGVDPNKPNQILMRARQPDGHELVALNDGSVQVRRSSR